MNTTHAISAPVVRVRGVGSRALPFIKIGVAVLANAAWILFLGYLVLTLFG